MMNETGKPLVYPFGFEPTLHRHRMDIPGKLKMGNNIFVGAIEFPILSPLGATKIYFLSTLVAISQMKTYELKRGEVSA